MALIIIDPKKTIDIEIEDATFKFRPTNHRHDLRYTSLMIDFQAEDLDDKETADSTVEETAKKLNLVGPRLSAFLKATTDLVDVMMTETIVEVRNGTGILASTPEEFSALYDRFGSFEQASQLRQMFVSAQLGTNKEKSADPN